MKTIDFYSIGIILGGLIAFSVTLVFGELLTHKNTVALTVMATVFSVFAGFTIAITTLLGDPGGLYPGSWRIASAHRRQVRRRLRRQAVLFYVYLLVLGLAFAAALLGNIKGDSELARWFERIALSFGAGAFVWSLALPLSVFRANVGRLDAEVDTRRPRGQSD